MAYSNSSLATVTIKVPKSKTYGTRTHKIDSVAIHHMAGKLTAKQCGNYFKDSSRIACSNYGIGYDGTIGLYADESLAPHCTSNQGVDNRAVSIEVSNSSNGSPWPVSDKSVDALVNLLVDICVRNKIPSLKFKNDKAYGIKASKGGSVSEQNVFLHEWFANKECPGPSLKKKIPDIVKRVNAKLDSNDKSYLVNDASEDGETGDEAEEGGSVTIDIDYTDLQAYIITIDRHTPDTVNFKKLKSKGVSGVMIEAGHLYGSAHNEVTFRNPKVYDQAKRVMKAGLDFGYYMTCRAKTLAEADKEMYQLSFLVRKYPPALGVWLKLALDNPVAKNNKILDKYYKELIRLGLADKMGLYVTRNQLKKITWEGIETKWYLHIIDHIKSVDEIKTLLDPVFFDIDGKSGPVIKVQGSDYSTDSTDASGDMAEFAADVPDKVRKYVNWAIQIAKDNSHGYSQASRNGPDYDCSSLVYYSLTKTGVMPKISSAFYTGSMGSILKRNGFKEHSYTSASDLKVGDILWKSGHTEIYIGNKQKVGAHKNYDGRQGDSKGNEISIKALDGGWTKYYRLGK